MKKWNLFFVIIILIPCTVNSVSIKIIQAQYGFLYKESTYRDVTEAVGNVCDNQKECRFIVNNTLTGIDPLPGAIKRLRLVVACENGEIFKKSHFEFKELSEVSIQCSDVHSEPISEIIRYSPYKTILMPGTVIGGVFGLIFGAGYITEIPSSSQITNSCYGLLGAYTSHKFLKYAIYSIEHCRKRT